MVIAAVLLTTAASAGLLLGFMRLLIRTRRPRSRGALRMVWITALIAFAVSWSPGFILGGDFGATVIGRAGEAIGLPAALAEFVGIALGITLATSALAIALSGSIGILLLSANRRGARRAGSARSQGYRRIY